MFRGNKVLGVPLDCHEERVARNFEPFHYSIGRAGNDLERSDPPAPPGFGSLVMAAVDLEFRGP